MRKNLILLIFSVCYLVSCSDHTVKIDGVIKDKNFDGKTMYLFYPSSSADFKAFEQLTETIINDGRFSFNIDIHKDKEAEMPTIAYLAMFDMNAENITEEEIGDTPIATLILEKGKITVELEGSSVILDGTSRNREFNNIHAVIKDIVDLANQMNDDHNINDIPLDAEGRDGQAQFQMLNDQLRDLTYEFSKKNMGNNVGEYLFLRSYTDNLFTPVQLKALIDAGTDKFRQRSDVKWLTEVLEQMNNENLQDTNITVESEVE